MTRRPLARSVLNRIGAISSSLGVELAPSPEQLKTAADTARGRSDRAGDVYFRRQICRLEAHRVGAWVQYGHALKEAGFHGRAEKAYQHALTLDPDSAEINLQLGHLSKVRGDLDGAARYFQIASDLGHPAVDDIRFQLNLCRRVDNKTIFRDAPQGQARSGVRFYLSSPTRMVREGTRADASHGLGRAEYSYAFAMKGFTEALEALELDYAVIEHPEFISDIRERSNAAVNIHLAFYPPERLRLLKGAYNIDCFAWEFDRLKSPAELVSAHAFGNQATMLERVDEIWTPSVHGSDSVRKSTSRPVHTVPSPILSNLAKRPRSDVLAPPEIEKALRGLTDVRWEPLAIVPSIQKTMEHAAHARRTSLAGVLSLRATEAPAKIFLCIFNVHDFRKQIEPLITAFMRFAEQDDSAILLLKITTPFRDTESPQVLLLHEQLGNPARLRPPLVSDRIWLTHDVLTRDELTRLYDVSSFYVCTSYAEGQNLPLLEAMGRGVVPVSVRHTAMSDYITDENAVVIASESRPMDIQLTTRYGLYGMETNFVDETDIASSLQSAAQMQGAEYAARSAASMQAVEGRFGLAEFAARIETLTQTLQDNQQAQA